MADLRAGQRVEVVLMRGGYDIDSSIHAGSRAVTKTGTVEEVMPEARVAFVRFDDGDVQMTYSREEDCANGYPVRALRIL